MRNLICRLCRIRILDWSILDFPGAINLDPALDTFETLKHNRTVDQQIADNRERTSRSQMDWLLEVINQRAAGLTGFAIDDHHAGTANLLEAVAFPDNWSNFLAICRYRILLDFHQGCNNVKARTIVYIELLRVRLFRRAVLAFDNKSDFFLFCHSICPPSYSFLATA